MTYAIGDIHGCATALQTLLNSGSFSADDRMIFLGDYINKGSASKKAIDILIALSQERHCVFLKGNHEIMMLAARDSALHFDQWLTFGGEATLKSYGISPKDNKWANQIPEAHWRFLESTDAFVKKDSFIFVHAGLEPGVPPEEQNTHHLYWKKYETPDKYADDVTVVCGHTSRKNGKIADFGHTICIDTFACGGQWLTMLNTDNFSFAQANEQGKLQRGQLRNIKT